MEDKIKDLLPLITCIDWISLSQKDQKSSLGSSGKDGPRGMIYAHPYMAGVRKSQKSWNSWNSGTYSEQASDLITVALMNGM